MLPRTIVAVLVAFVAGGEARAIAQTPEQRSWAERPLAAPSNTIELTFSTGYTQPFGMVEQGLSMPSLTRPGFGFDLGLGFRLSERWSIGVLTQYNENLPERSESTRGLVGGVATTYHFAPEIRVDPWLEVGAGYRFLWENSIAATPDTLWHGFRVVSARVGVDVRATQALAFAPFIGADANVFLWRDTGSGEPIADPRLNTFVYAGIQTRLDAGGTHVVGRPIAASDASER